MYIILFLKFMQDTFNPVYFNRTDLYTGTQIGIIKHLVYPKPFPEEKATNLYIYW